MFAPHCWQHQLSLSTISLRVTFQLPYAFDRDLRILEVRPIVFLLLDAVLIMAPMLDVLSKNNYPLQSAQAFIRWQSSMLIVSTDGEYGNESNCFVTFEQRKDEPSSFTTFVASIW